MLSSSRKFRGRSRRDRSPFSSPRTGLLASPLGARRSSLEERRRPAGGFNHEGSFAPKIKIEEEGPEEEEEEEVEDEDEELDEDGDAETTPLLPIFSAAHLGRPVLPLNGRLTLMPNSVYHRLLACLQSHAHHSLAHRPSMRNNPLMGPATIAPSLPVPGQADPARNKDCPLLESYIIRANGQLFAIRQRSAIESGQ